VSDSASLFQRLWRRPQGVWARRALFQIHLWSGIAIGLYLILISLTGSLLVFRIELHKMFERPPLTVAVSGERLNDDQLKAAAKRTFPDHTVTNVWPAKKQEDPVEIWLSRDDTGRAIHRLFNPYTGENLGPPEPAMVRFIVWLASLHDDLLAGEKGRRVNGYGAIVLTVLCVTGLVIWWPGISNWRRSLTVDLKSNWKLFNWNLHSAVGFWSFLLVLLWAVSGIYLAFPNPFQDVVDHYQPLESIKNNQARLGDQVLQWLSRLHFGRFGGWPIKALWTVLGLIPLILFITGAVMWWNRVLRPAWDKLRLKTEAPTPLGEAQARQRAAVGMEANEWEKL
jgi:uncharacterized iron-regulated membrane protein